MIYLEVPFREKDQAKALGARWDNLTRKWFVPSELEGQLELFSRWLPLSTEVPSVQAPAFAIPDPTHAPMIDHPSEQKGAPLSVVLKNVQQSIRQSFPGALWVIAEIANLNSNRGHLYLELVETSSQGQTLASCRAMIWQSLAAGLLMRFEQTTGSQLTVGQKVLLLTEVSFHEQYGFSLTIQDIDPAFTLGELEAKLNEIRKRLISENLYKKNKQHLLPEDFFRVAVIAPPGAAGLGDFRADADALQHSGLCAFHYFYSAFQGEQVEKELHAALDAFESLHHSNPFDALVIIRGGGAKLDLNALNLYTVAKRICEAGLPILTGIGHERDNTILDEVAHTRYDTPSKVIGDIRHRIFQQAKLAQQHWKQIEQSSQLRVRQLNHQLDRLHYLIQQDSRTSLHTWKERLQPLRYQLQRRGQQKIQATYSRLLQLQQRVEGHVNRQLHLSQIHLEQHHATVHQEVQRALNFKRNQLKQWIGFVLSSGPKSQLSRGFVIAKSPQGKPIKTAERARQLGTLQLQFIDGTVSAEIAKDAHIQPNPGVSDLDSNK